MATRGVKRKALTLEERVSVVKRSRNGETAKRIAETLGIGKTQLQSIIKDQDSVMNRWEDGEHGEKKRLAQRHCPYAAISEKVWAFMCSARARNIPVSGKLLQEQAILISVELGLDDFSASNGWLDRWKKRYQVSCAALSGESASVDEDLCKTWKEWLPQLIKGYELKDVFNADETGLFYRALPTRSMVAKGASSAGVKINKNRVTAPVAASATGEKLMPLIIEKSAKPRCFQNVKLKGLGIDYRFNKRAWMTRDIFSEWANKLNNKMKSQQRSIILFLDNCAAHPPLELSNIKIIMLPPNSTSKLQPCDAGIIQAIKLNYRKRFTVLHSVKDGSRQYSNWARAGIFHLSVGCGDVVEVIMGAHLH